MYLGVIALISISALCSEFIETQLVNNTENRIRAIRLNMGFKI
jgi:hypothetical protein